MPASEKVRCSDEVVAHRRSTMSAASIAGRTIGAMIQWFIARLPGRRTVAASSSRPSTWSSSALEVGAEREHHDTAVIPKEITMAVSTSACGSGSV